MKESVLHFKDEVMKRYRGRIGSIILFGSFARGKERPESDIDLLVVWKGDKVEGWKKLEAIAFRILLETRDYISLKVFTNKEFQMLKTEKNSFISNVIKEGITIV